MAALARSICFTNFHAVQAKSVLAFKSAKNVNRMAVRVQVLTIDKELRQSQQRLLNPLQHAPPAISHDDTEIASIGTGFSRVEPPSPNGVSSKVDRVPDNRGYGGGRNQNNRGRSKGTPSPPRLPINNEIRVEEVRVIGKDKAPLGVMPLSRALELAIEHEVDLVMAIPHADPPVCKLISYEKFKFESLKDDRDKKKSNRDARVVIRDLKLTGTIDANDIDLKVRQAQRLLAGGDRVRFTMRLKGREVRHRMEFQDVLKRVADALEAEAVVDRPPVVQGRAMMLYLSPKKLSPNAA